jgi:hypothetical protein
MNVNGLARLRWTPSSKRSGGWVCALSGGGFSRARTPDGWRGTGSLFRRPQNPLGYVKEFGIQLWTITITSILMLLQLFENGLRSRMSALGPPTALILIVDGTLDDCIRQFMAKPTSQHHLYEIHTAPQGELVSAVLSGILILEIVRLRDFL